MDQISGRLPKGSSALTAVVLKGRALIGTAGHGAGSGADRHVRKGRTPIMNKRQTLDRALIRSPRAEVKGQGPE